MARLVRPSLDIHHAVDHPAFLYRRYTHEEGGRPSAGKIGTRRAEGPDHEISP